jgi:hypothetical protein
VTVTGLPPSELYAGLRFMARVPAFLRRSFTDVEARALVRERLADRATAFLALARRSIYERRDSPYRALLQAAGCELGDLARLVHADGVEGALEALVRRGVYLTVAELKGRTPVRRGNTVLTIDPMLLATTASLARLTRRTSGSRGPPAPVPMDLDTVRDRAVYRYLAIAAQGGVGWRHALWVAPGLSPIVNMLQFCAGGMWPARWFSQVDPASPSLSPDYRWSGRGLRTGAWLVGRRLPGPIHVSPDDPLPIVRWMRQVAESGGTPHVETFPSSAVRLCQAATAAGLDVAGARFTVVGEPLTPARMTLIGRTGAVAHPKYSTVECGPIAGACAAPATADDVHLHHDRHALVQPGTAAPALPSDALLVTTLRPEAPIVLLNVSLGDRAVLASRACGCPLERLGWTTHLHTVRSFEKLTAGGVSLPDADVVRILDEVLPRRFGGGPTSYQLVESTTEGALSLTILVHPALGPVDETMVRDVFLAAVAGLSSTGRLIALRWRGEGLPRVERGLPMATATGKILHVHQRGSGSPSVSGRPPRAVVGER